MSARNGVLVVVDLQNGFIRDSSRPLIPVVAALVDQWQRHGKDVVFTRYVNYPGSPFERDLTPWLIEDASASHAGQEAHEAGLLVASRFIGRGQIITTADAARVGVRAGGSPGR
ncbi:hypothetical protein ACIBCA_13695 [Kitasatospora sp. NPDC051170]|uniref:hypothetical protein n=1 Tax=Kitasatospora sp. NPDC051170 TaxID=3364056 RepID=UPI00378AF84D